MILSVTAARDFNAERQGVTSSSSMFFGSFGAAGENIGLHRRAQRNHLVGIQIGVGLRALEQFVHQLAHRGNARRSADQHDFIDLLRRDAGIFQRLFAGPTVRLMIGSIICSNSARGISRR